MRSLSLVGLAGLAVILLGSALATGCSKQSRTTAPPAAAPATATPGNGAPPPSQGIAVGEPHPGPDGRPATVTEADVALADRLIIAISKMADGVNKAGSDCPAVATAIRTMAPEFGAISGEAKQMEERLKSDPAAEEWFDKTYSPKAKASMSLMENSPCMNDPAVGQALQSLNF